MAAGVADWPARTTDISEIGIDVSFVPAGAVGKLLGRLSGGAATLRIRIVDYPGEWLLDLPLLEQTFADWSPATLRLLRKCIRVEIAGVVLNFLAQLAPVDSAISPAAKTAHELNFAFLLTSRDPHIDRVLFAATTADHVPDIQRDHLAELLRSMAAFPALDVRSADARIDVAALAAVVSTAEDVQEIDGQRVPVVVGRPVGNSKQAKFFVGTVPIRPPRPDAWGSSFLNVPVFEPPAIEPSPVDGIPHINLDLAVEFLLGDRLR